MFTGIIQAIGSVTSLATRGEGGRLSLQAGRLCEGVRKGDSIAVSGVCLTAVTIRPPAFEFDVNRETLDRTTLHTFRPGRRVNLEKALSVGDPLGGHFVQGHVDGVGKVSRMERRKGATLLGVEIDADLALFLVQKGSVAVDGVSLTIVDVGERKFTVTLIPETLDSTTLGERSVGDSVNVEADILSKTIVRHLERMGGRGKPGKLTMEGLSEAGFL